MTKRLASMLALTLPLAVAQSNADGPSEIEQLKQMLLDQQRQINELKQKLGMAVNAHPAIGEVASTKPMVPATPAAAPPTFTPPPPPASTSSAAPPAAPDDANTSPLQFKLG